MISRAWSPATQDQWLRLESFEYAPLSDRLAVVRVRAGLGPELLPPAGARLVIQRGEEASAHSAAGSVTHRAVQRRRGTQAELLWRVTFAVDLELVEYPRALFELTALERVALQLPAPNPCAFAAFCPADVHTRQAYAALPWRRLVAMTTAVAVATASTSPVGLAFADSPGSAVVGSNPGPASQVQTVSGQPVAPQLSGPATPSVGGTRIARLPAGAPQTPSATPNTPTTTTTTTSATTTTTTTAAPQASLTVSASPSPAPKLPTPPNCELRSPRLTPHLSLVDSARPGAARPGRPVTRPDCTPKPPHKLPVAPVAPGAPVAPPFTVSQPHGTGITGGHKPHAHGHHVTPHKHAVLPRNYVSGGAPLAPIGTLSAHAPTRLAKATEPKRHAAAPVTETAAPLGSSLWTGGLSADPTAAAVMSRLSGLFANVDGPPPFLIPIYKRAARRYHVPWQVLAAINSIETDYGRNLNISSAGAIGWMQFMPGTWREYGVATNGHGKPNPYDPTDAIFAAARYLRANGAPQHLRQAIFAYNHATWYVDSVLWRAQIITDHALKQRHGKGYGGYALPLDGRYMHQLGRTDDGLDIETAPDGAPVYSITPGVVTAVASDAAGFGPNYPVILVTAGPLAGQFIYYGHVAVSLVKVGEHVVAGQPVAVMGHTGDAASLGHGHIEIGFSDGSGSPLNHHGATAWTPSGAAMRHVLVAIAAAFKIKTA